MKLFSWNVNGIRAVIRKGEFNRFISVYDPDILCLQETKALKDQVEIDLLDYEEYWNSSTTKKGYSGTAIFSKVKPIEVTNDIPEQYVKSGGLVSDDYGHSNQEGRVITAQYENFFLVNTYTPNAKDNLSRLPLRQQWDEAITSYCSNLQKIKPVVYCGDMNVAHTELDLANPNQNKGKKGFTKEERAGFDNWLSAGFIDTFRIFKQGSGYYTWWSNFANSRARNIGWRIDYFLVSSSLKADVVSANIHPEQMGSDHCPVSIELVV